MAGSVESTQQQVFPDMQLSPGSNVVYSGFPDGYREVTVAFWEHPSPAKQASYPDREFPETTEVEVNLRPHSDETSQTLDEPGSIRALRRFTVEIPHWVDPVKKAEVASHIAGLGIRISQEMEDSLAMIDGISADNESRAGQ